ncbi:hypothetical protein E2C01_024934 [Portunus trituberculatus]|uniref:Uncharacterized protein n=1 Tax=Portunus trituberculatus TaxID=210409 RepID=A0A5B7EE67_PORTR|nr:hypothetical protein [Portunus trituberculatus]
MVLSYTNLKIKMCPSTEGVKIVNTVAINFLPSKDSA